MTETKAHILIISQCFYPEEFRVNDLAAEWVKEGHKVTAVTSIPNYPGGDFFPGYGLFRRRKELWKGVTIHHLPVIPRKHGSVMLALNYLSFVISGAFFAFFTRTKADRVFIFETSPMTQALAGVWYARRRKIPCDLYIQDLWPDNVEIVAGIHNRFVLRALHRMCNYIYKNCTRILVTSPAFERVMKKRTDTPVIYWPQYAEAFYVPVPCKESHEELRIIFTGNVGVAQGLEILPEAAALLKQSAQDAACAEERKIVFHIVGDGRSMEAFREEIRRTNTEEMFVLHGRKPAAKIPQMLADADVAFLSFMDTPLFKRTIPAKLQSYLACGIPVLASAGGETKRILKEADCGWVCPLGDAAALAATIREISESPRKALQLKGENALAYSRAHFDKKTLLAQFWGEDACNK